MANRVSMKSFPLIQTDDERLQCTVCTYLLNGPLQFPCGHRICMPCARKLKQDNALAFYCKKCKETINFSDYFHDKAVAKEVDSTIVTCPHCGWSGEYRHLQGHIKDECKLVKVSRSNDETFTKSQIKNHDHLQNCQHSSTITNQLIKRDAISNHMANGNSTAQECKFVVLGCQFAGDDAELAIHMRNDMIIHLDYICKFLSSYTANHSSHKTNGHVQFSKDNEAMEQLLFTDFQKLKATIEKVSGEGDVTKSQAAEIQRKQEDFTFRLNGVEDLLTTMQASITEINRTYEEVSLTLQTLQATSYNGKYIWKIPDITRRRRDAVTGKTVSLYSAPFYTDRFGYRMCLRVYLDGDGSGKGCYISYFLTIMKGEYDALLEWPFQLTVTMTMINQKGNGNITQSFKPNPNSASFHRPKTDMNVASGCPKFAVLSVLDNPEFVVDDVAFFQCVINNK